MRDGQKIKMFCRDDGPVVLNCTNPAKYKVKRRPPQVFLGLF